MRPVYKLLIERAEACNNTAFIPNDPIDVPHRFSQQGDIEVAAFFAALFAWGQRKTILNKTRDLMMRMDNDPFAFVMSASPLELRAIEGFVHRTFNAQDVVDLIYALRATHNRHGSWEVLFQPHKNEHNFGPSITRFREEMLKHVSNPTRVSRFLSDPSRGSAAKRIVMFLRWMVRQDNAGVDFGIWKTLPMSKLSCPLDVHTARSARKLKLLTRKQNDWRAVEELDEHLRLIDPNDPARFDYALFCMGLEDAADL